MKNSNFFYLLTIAIISLLAKVSFFSVILPHGLLLDPILAFFIAAVAVRGFKKMLPLIIIISFLSDLVLYQPLGSSVIFFAIVAYFMSFFSRRFLMENKFWGYLLMTFFVLITTFFQRLYWTAVVSFEKKTFFRPYLLATSEHFWKEEMLSLALFFLYFWFFNRIFSRKKSFRVPA